jgi:hypothetical protein
MDLHENFPIFKTEEVKNTYLFLDENNFEERKHTP